MISQLQERLKAEAQEKLQNNQYGHKIVKILVRGQIDRVIDDYLEYTVHWKFVKQQENFFYIEELQEQRSAVFANNTIIRHEQQNRESEKNKIAKFSDFQKDFEERTPFYYDRQKAVQYAERWWNSFNPQFKKFNDDCTNFISQCLLAGGFPMSHSKARNKGWWYRNNNWSFSWAVAHAFMLFLTASPYTRQVTSEKQLNLGDIICYDFEGDGRFNHNTIVTGFDGNNQPLVNAHTTNSRQRFWNYHNSTAYTPNIRYKFFQIVGSTS